MAIPTSKPLSLSTVQTEYGGTNPIGMSEYRGYAGAPDSGAIDLWGDFNGTTTYDQILYADDYGRADDTSYIAAISNQDNNTFIQAGDEDDLNTHVARNEALISTLSGKSVTAVRGCTIYLLGTYFDYSGAASNIYVYPQSSSGSNITPILITSGSAQPSPTFTTVSYDFLAGKGETVAADFIEGGCRLQINWNVGDDLLTGQPKCGGLWVDLEFDYR